MSTFIPSKDLAFPQGSLILVTGASGMIAANIVDEALKAGFRVRGTVRSVEKGRSVAELFNAAGFEFFVVEDLAAENAFHEAIKGVSGVIHTASIHTFSDNLSDVSGPLVRGCENILEAALENPTVKKVVFTSSTGTAANPQPGIKFHIGRDTWNTVAIDLVKNTPLEKRGEMGFEWKMNVYRVAKVEAEKAVWNFVEQRKPTFGVNVVNPGLNFGKAKGSIGISGSQVLNLLHGNMPQIPSRQFLAPCYLS